MALSLPRRARSSWSRNAVSSAGGVWPAKPPGPDRGDDAPESTGAAADRGRDRVGDGIALGGHGGAKQLPGVAGTVAGQGVAQPARHPGRVEGQHAGVTDPQDAELALELLVAGERQLGRPRRGWRVPAPVDGVGGEPDPAERDPRGGGDRGDATPTPAALAEARYGETAREGDAERAEREDPFGRRHRGARREPGRDQHRGPRHEREQPRPRGPLQSRSGREDQTERGGREEPVRRDPAAGGPGVEPVSYTHLT